MKKMGEIFLIIIIMVGLVVVPLSRADSGWDGSYGGGSSSSSGGSSSSWGGGSSSSGGGSGGSSSWGSDYGSHSSGGSSTTELLFDGAIVLAFVVGGIVYLVYKFILKANSIMTDISYRNIVAGGKLRIVGAPYDIELVKKVLPDFSKEEFGLKTFEIYKNIQVAWQDFDLDSLRKHTSDELFNLYNSQLAVLKNKKQKNVMRDFAMLDFEVVGMEHNGDNLVLIVQMLVKCYDYVVDAQEKVVRGTSKYKVMYYYEMAFKMGLGEDNKRCPNCNAMLEGQNSNVCEYCDSVIISNNHDWVLAKKKVLGQEGHILD